MIEGGEQITLHAETRHLPVKLTELEMLAMAGKWRGTMQEKEAMEARHEAKKAEMKEELAAIGGLAKMQAKIASSGYEQREVPVLHVLRPNQAKVEVVREDTGEVIDVRPATQAELQRSLPVDMGDREQREAVEEATEEATKEELIDEAPVPESDAYADGALAFRQGWTLDENPFDDADEAVNWQCWVDGYKKAAEGAGAPNGEAVAE